MAKTICRCVCVDLIKTLYGEKDGLKEIYECGKCGKQTIYIYKLVECYDEEKENE